MAVDVGSHLLGDQPERHGVRVDLQSALDDGEGRRVRTAAGQAGRFHPSERRSPGRARKLGPEPFEAGGVERLAGLDGIVDALPGRRHSDGWKLREQPSRELRVALPAGRAGRRPANREPSAEVDASSSAISASKRAA